MANQPSDPTSNVTFARNVDWNLFKVFHEISRQQGIGAAARSLNKQQPSVSAALQRLESYLDTPLCSRTSRGIELTVQGHQVKEICEIMYQQVQAAARLQGGDLANVGGSLSIHLISNLYLVPSLSAIFEEFHRRYPLINVRMEVSPWRKLLRSLSDGEIELAIGFTDTFEDHRQYIQVIDQQQQIYCGPEHPLFGKPPVAPSELAAYPFVITHDEPTAYLNYRQKYSLGEKVGGVADNLQERMWLIRLGMGIGILPKPVVDASSISDVLWPMVRESEAPSCSIYLMAHSDDSIRSAPAQLFLDTALNYLQGEPMPA